jgi:ATP-dependent DNA helicase RecG
LGFLYQAEQKDNGYFDGQGNLANRANQPRKQIPVDDDPLTFLRKHSLIDGENITNACWLMFLPEQDVTTTIELGHFASETVIKDSLTLKTDLFTEVEEVMEFVRKHINKEIIITGSPQNTLRWEYPLDAIRELVLNMIVHRDYTSSYDSVIKIHKNHIEFYNPGTLPDSISVEKLLNNDYVSQPHNKQIAEIFKEVGLIEKYGSGIKRVREEFIECGLPEPTFIQMSTGMLIRVYGTGYLNKDVTENVTENVAENVTENREQLILQLLHSDHKISTSELATRFGITRRTVHRDLEKLKEKGILERVGPDKGGYWKILK